MATISTFAAFSSRGYGAFTSGRLVPTGGDFVIDNNGAGKRVHVFLGGGTFTVPAETLPTNRFVDLEILVVGGGGPAGSSDSGGGGGGGGAVIYDSAFRIPKGHSLSVTVGGAGQVSKVTGLHAAPGGGTGGTSDRYSKGQPGGCGGGGSWQNAGPNGGEYTLSNPGATWGTSGPAAPANVTPAFPTPAIGPTYAPGLTVDRTFNAGYHNNRGNGQYGCSSATPDSSKGIAGSITSPAPGTSYSPKAFRMRGGGGASYVGGLGGQGILTDFRTLENGTYEFILAGGHGDLPNNGDRSWNSLKQVAGAKGLRDSGVYNGTFYDAGDSYISSPSQVNWETEYDNPVQSSVENAPSGSETYGSGGSRTHEQDGGRGFLILRYLDSAVTSASANVFGGNISTSANGQYRYHIWYGDETNDGSYKGTSANSQGYIAFNDEGNYRAKYFNSNTEEAYYTVKGKDGQPRGANTTPFYFYQDVPAFSVQYMLVGGGGSMGTRGNSVHPGGLNYLVGGGGSGGIAMGSFTTPSQAPSSYNMPELPSSLANSASFGDQITGSFQHRLGYIEVRANSLLTTKLSTSKYLSSLDNDVNAYHRQRQGTIRIRGSGNESARLLQRLRRDTIEGYFADNGNNDTGKRYLVYASNNPGDPQSDGWGSSINLNDGYESYFYTNYTRVRAGRKAHIMQDGNDNSGPTTDYSEGNPSWNNNIEFELGTGSTAETFVATPTGTHPQTGESYYNALRITRALPRISSGGDDLGTNRYSQFHSAISNFNSSSPGWEVRDPPMQSGLNNVDNLYNRNFNMNVGSVFGGGRTLRGSYVLQQGENTATRRFEHINWDDGNHNVSVDAGWKIVDVNAGTVNRMTYTTESEDTVRTRVEVWRRSLRKIWIRHLFAFDTSIGNGGKGNKQPSARRRSGGTTSLHMQNDDNPSYSAGGGGAGGWHTYSSEGESPVDAGGPEIATSDRSPGTYAGAGVGTSPMNWGTLTPAGSGGGAAHSINALSESSNPVPGGSAGPGGSTSETLGAYASGGGGGGSIADRDSTVKFGGATRGLIFSGGRDSKRNAGNSSNGHGGRGWFGSTTNWPGTVGVQNISGTNYYYYVDVNQFPHNAQFAAGGGGGASNADGGDGSGTSGGTGGNGADGVSYSLTGYATIYGHGGGGMGRFVNGTPGSGQPADPSTQTVPSGAPSGALYLPYGGGGGYSAGRQEGGGAGGGPTQYYPGSGPWPTAYDVSFGTAHMDYMRYINSNVPGPQKGDFGTAYSGKQGVVIISYDRAPYFS
jgi:hypothetical protein